MSSRCPYFVYQAHKSETSRPQICLQTQAAIARSRTPLLAGTPWKFVESLDDLHTRWTILSPGTTTSCNPEDQILRHTKTNCMPLRDAVGPSHDTCFATIGSRREFPASGSHKPSTLQTKPIFPREGALGFRNNSRPPFFFCCRLKHRTPPPNGYGCRI